MANQPSLVLADSHRLGRRHGMAHHPLGVPFGMGITSFQRLRQRPDRLEVGSYATVLRHDFRRQAGPPVLER